MDLTINCIIKFTEAVFIGTYPKAKFSHERTITGKITKDSYGQKTGQHTFSIDVIECDDDNYSCGENIRRKGRNVYRNCKVIAYPDNHQELADEKHSRSKSKKEGIAMKRAFDKGDHEVYERYSNT